MRHTSLSLLFLLLPFTVLGDVFRLNFISGLNLATFREVYYEENSYNRSPGLIQGIGLGFGGGTHFQVSPELLISQKGAESDVFNDARAFNTYFEIPVLFRFYFGPPTAPVRAFAHIGPHFDFLIFHRTSRITDDDQSLDLTEALNPIDFGYTVGGGISAKAGPGNILVEFRYSRGLVSIFDDEWLSDNYIVNSTFTTLIGYGVTFGSYNKVDDDDEEDEEEND